MSRTSDTVRKCMELAGINQTELANRMGIDRRNLSEMLTRQKDLKTEKFIEMLECIGFSIDLQKIDAYRVNGDMAARIHDTNQPFGKFWSVKDGAYLGIVSEASGCSVEYFADKESLMEWFGYR